MSRSRGRGGSSGASASVEEQQRQRQRQAAQPPQAGLHLTSRIPASVQRAPAHHAAASAATPPTLPHAPGLQGSAGRGQGRHGWACACPASLRGAAKALLQTPTGAAEPAAGAAAGLMLLPAAAAPDVSSSQPWRASRAVKLRQQEGRSGAGVSAKPSGTPGRHSVLSPCPRLARSPARPHLMVVPLASCVRCR